MRAERHNHEGANQVVNRSTVSDRNVCDSGDALGNLSRTLAANEGKDELNTTVLERLSLCAITKERLDGLRINELLECSSGSSLFEERANHRGVRCGLTIYLGRMLSA